MTARTPTNIGFSGQPTPRNMASGKETHRASTGFDMCNNGLLGTTRDLAGISAYQT
jgi:hypothetical protein